MLRSFLISALMILCMTACNTSKSTVSSKVKLSNYEYASIINDDTYYLPAELMEYDIMLFDAVESSRLQMIGERRIYELTPQQQSKLLLVKFGVTQNEQGATVIVNFIDYMTGRPVASCRGVYSMGIGMDPYRDMKGAIKRVAKQISNTFPK